jgi:nucleotide-binding universal stress UspA family protein
MKKILLIIDGLNYVADDVRFAASVAAASGSKLSGLFIQDTSVISSGAEMKMVAGQVYVEEIALSGDEQLEINKKIEKNIALFHEDCAASSVIGHSLRAQGVPLEVVLRESRFSDMLIISPLLSFSAEKNIPTHFVTGVLTASECPVLLIPEIYRTIDEIVVAYDGSRSAAFAIRQFSQILSGLGDKPVKVLHITEEGNEHYDLRYDDLFADWMNFHFTDFTIISFRGNARDVLFNYFMEEKESNNKLLVAGAYGRNAISRFFRPGTTDLVLKVADIPVFIAHS